MRILIASDAPDSLSGYANQLRLFAPRIARLGHDVALLATFGHQGAVRSWTSNVPDMMGTDVTLRVYPGGADAFANDVIGHSARDWKADIVITLKDTHVFQPQALDGCRWCPMTPVDHEPLPQAITERLRYAYRPIAYAPNGVRELQKAGFDPLYAPHAYDPAVFKPAPHEDARKFLQLPMEWFIVGTVAVNRGGWPSRKAWPQNLEAFAKFARGKPHARYFVHTDLAADGFEGGVNIPALVAGLGIGGQVIYCDQERYRRGGFPEEYLLAYYNSIDVLNAVSLGEGFGIPQLEAQACGTPVIASKYAAARDLCLAGWHVDGPHMYDQQGSWVFNPDPATIAEALELAYKAKPLQTPYLRDQALARTVPYQIDRVIQEHWVPVLAELEAGMTIPSRGVLRVVRREEVGV